MASEKRYPAAILFDLDGTLYDKRFLFPLLGLTSLVDIRLLWAFFAARESKAGVDFGSRDALLDAISLDVALRLPGKEPETLRRWYDECLYGRFTAILRFAFRARPCVSKFLSVRGALTRKRFSSKWPRLGVLSDYGHVDDRLHAIGLNPMEFDMRLSCEDEGALKPAIRPFLRAAEILDVPPGEILVVGDRYDLDGVGAHAAGMTFRRLSNRRAARALFFELMEP